MEFEHPVKLIEGHYDPQEFFQMAKGLEDIPEGGERCFKCYRLRMEEAAKLAEEGGYDYFTTTLSISPLKNAAKINEIGEELAEIYHVQHLPSDFKKRTAINVPSNYPTNTTSTVRTTAVASIPEERLKTENKAVTTIM